MRHLGRARLARNTARRSLSEGIDPVQAKIDAKLATLIRISTQFEAVARDWFEHWERPRSPGHAVAHCHHKRNSVSAACNHATCLTEQRDQSFVHFCLDRNFRRRIVQPWTHATHHPQRPRAPRHSCLP